MRRTFFMSDGNEVDELRGFPPNIDARPRVLSTLCPNRELCTLLNAIQESAFSQATPSNNGFDMSDVFALAWRSSSHDRAYRLQ
jgi:hypothetical protein